MRYKALIVAIVALAALVGCSNGGSTSGSRNGTSANQAAGKAAGGGTNNAAGGGGGNPCSLITKDEASAVLGEQAKDGVGHSSQGTKQCQWDSANGSVAILVFIGGQKASWTQTHDLAKQTYAAKFSDVSGLGDAAFSNGFDVHILKGDDMYQIGVAGPFQDKVTRAITVAKEALARA
jgi:hypothetical protein